MIHLENDFLKLTIHEAGTPFYRGTRFDHSGLMESVLWEGTELAGRWFEHFDPLIHDCVCGPAEEFGAVGFEDAAPGECFVKPGVGLLLRPDAAPYDRFRLYEIAAAGEWEFSASESSAKYVQRIPGVYNYTKRIALTGPSGFEIRHAFESSHPRLRGEMYNHNFWTFNRMQTGPSRRMDFPFRPEGDWRSRYDSVALSGSGIRFSRELGKGESVFMGNLHKAGESGMPYSLRLSDGDIGIEITGDVPVLRTVFWANHRVACIEPYNAFFPGARWTVRYNFSRNPKQA